MRAPTASTMRNKLLAVTHSSTRRVHPVHGDRRSLKKLHASSSDPNHTSTIKVPGRLSEEMWSATVPVMMPGLSMRVSQDAKRHDTP